MICLKTRTFAVSQTTYQEQKQHEPKLWFAWKLVLLQYRKQPSGSRPPTSWVVICLKTRTFAVSQTTISQSGIVPTRLWFAWKLVLLQYRKQQTKKTNITKRVVICLKTRTFAVSQTTLTWVTLITVSCDLLENSYFCSIANNALIGRNTLLSLWFAWKLVLLQYRKQPLSK